MGPIFKKKSQLRSGKRVLIVVSLLSIVILASVLMRTSNTPVEANHKNPTKFGFISEKYSLTVNAIPDDSTIKIMNIKPKYEPGIKLKAGKYDILVKHKGYQRWRKWVEIDRDFSIDVVLKKKKY